MAPCHVTSMAACGGLQGDVPMRDARARRLHSTSGLGLFRLLLEISQIRRGLVLLDRHQEAVGAECVFLPADTDQHAAFTAIAYYPARTRIGAVHVLLVHGPGPRQRMVDH